MRDTYQREINYLRVSVTDRCNLRCVYCMPPGGVKSTPHEQVLRLEEIETIIRAAALVGIKKIRLTGGAAGAQGAGRPGAAHFRNTRY